MTSRESASWILRIFILCLLGAAAAGLYFTLSKGWFDKDEAKRAGLRLTSENFAEVVASPNRLTVVNMAVEGNPGSKKLQEILEKLKQEKYGERVTVAELDVKEEPELAASQGVKEENFAGHLDFHANGKKLEQLVGETDPVVVEKTIDRLLAGPVQRISKDWLPEVPGMQRNQGQDVIKLQPADPAKPPVKP
jgi:hypothetical protein